MNDERIKYNLLYVLFALLLSSCSAQEETGLRVVDSDDSDILFYASLPDVSVHTRSYDSIDAGHLSGGFSVTAMNLEREGNGTLDLYFEKKQVSRTNGMGDAFRGDGCKWPENTNGRDGRLKFFAFYPSMETLYDKAVIEPGDKTEYFLVHHSPLSTKTGNTYSFNYRMGNYLINKDISTHSDFVSASVEGSKTENLYSGVELKFEHKLCKVDVKAWGNNQSFDIEIAGVRLGGVMRKSTYNLAGNWISHAATWGSVEYIFRNEKDDKVIRISKGSHDSSSTATSIMGNGGFALLIPHQPSNLSGKPIKWNNTGDSKNSGNGMYISVLMRVTDRNSVDNYMQLFPYLDGSSIDSDTIQQNGKDVITTHIANNKNVVHLVVEKNSGKILKRVYKKFKTKEYFYDSDTKNPYSLDNDKDIIEKEDVEIREYGWAAVPYVATWTINNQYTYTLNYTNGVGYHDPADDAPGKAIITPLSVGISEEGGDWEMVKNYEDVPLEEGKDFTYIQE